MSQESTRSSYSSAVPIAGLIAGAGLLVFYAFSQRSKTNHVAYGGQGRRKAGTNSQSPKQTATAVFKVNAPPADAYRLWRDFANLPRFMAHVESVQVIDERRSEWTVKGPLNSHVRWTAEITEDEPDQRIAWRSLPDSEVENRGWVEFRADPQGRGSTVRALVEYRSSLGTVGKAVITALGKHPEFIIKEDLRRFKAILEAGEAPTTLGQAHGPRGLRGRLDQVLFRETSNRVTPQGASTSQATPAVA